MIKVKRPGLALCIFFGVGLLLHMYGMNDGSLFLLDIVLGVALYKALSR